MWQILDTHRQVVNSDIEERHQFCNGFDAPSIVEIISDHESDDDCNGMNISSTPGNFRNTDISRDLDDLKEFLAKTKTAAQDVRVHVDKLHDDDDFTGRRHQPSVADIPVSNGNSRVNLPDFSHFDHIDFNSDEVDPDLLQVSWLKPV